MTYVVERSKQFKKDYKLCKKQGKDMSAFLKVHELLIQGKKLPEKYVNHNLTGNWKGYQDCHIEPDWVLIYKIDKNSKIIRYARMGSHSNLF